MAVRGLKVATVCVGILLIGCIFTQEITYDARVVSEIPDGFISLEEIETDGFEYIFWESQISIMWNQSCVFQTSVQNKEFIVKYQGEYYVDPMLIRTHGDGSVNPKEDKGTVLLP